MTIKIRNQKEFYLIVYIFWNQQKIVSCMWTFYLIIGELDFITENSNGGVVTSRIFLIPPKRKYSWP